LGRSHADQRFFAALGVRSDDIWFSEHLAGDSERVFHPARKPGLEGLVSKRRDAVYRSNQEWIKIKSPDSPAMQRLEDLSW
jgi:ATP-dependent DNA ligase